MANSITIGTGATEPQEPVAPAEGEQEGGEGGEPVGEQEMEQTPPPALTISRVFMKQLPDGKEIEIGAQTTISVVVNSNIAVIVEWGTPSMLTLTLPVLPLTHDSTALGGWTRVGTQANSPEIFNGKESSGAFELNTEATAIALPDNGYKFDGWYADNGSGEATNTLVSTDAVYTFKITASTTLHAKFSKDTSSLYRWEGSDKNKTMRWCSKVYELNKPANLTSVKVDATGYPLARFAYTTYSAPGTPVRSVALEGGGAIQGAGMRRLPVRRPEKYFQVKVASADEVDAITVGTSGEGLAT